MKLEPQPTRSEGVRFAADEAQRRKPPWVTTRRSASKRGPARCTLLATRGGFLRDTPTFSRWGVKAAAPKSASDIALHLPYESAEAAWAFVDRVFAKTTSTKVLGLLAAGILEELIALDGANSLHVLRGMLERYPILAEVLHGVWQGDTPDAVWQEVLRLRSE